MYVVNICKYLKSLHVDLMYIFIYLVVIGIFIIIFGIVVVLSGICIASKFRGENEVIYNGKVCPDGSCYNIDTRSCVSCHFNQFSHYGVCKNCLIGQVGYNGQCENFCKTGGFSMDANGGWLCKDCGLNQVLKNNLCHNI